MDRRRSGDRGDRSDRGDRGGGMAGYVNSFLINNSKFGLQLQL